MWVISGIFPQAEFRFTYSTWLFWIFLLAGFTLTAIANRSLSRHRTTSLPGRKSLPRASKLVTTGIYRYSRNPVYLGMALLLLAWTFFLENWFSASGMVLFVFFISIYQIIPEEKALGERFGQTYSRYKGKVRRWL